MESDAIHGSISMGSVPLPSVAFVLRHQANAGALLNLGVLICDFLGPSPNLSFQEACQAESIPLLEWLWRLSCTSVDARSSRWTLCNFLRSDPHYRDYQLHHALKVASSRGNLTMVKWLVDHFPSPQVSPEVVEVAARNGHSEVLEFLLTLKDGAHLTEGPSRKKRKLDERGLDTQKAEKTAKRTSRASRLGDADLADFLLRGGGREVDASAFLTPERVDAILEFAADPDCAVHAFPAVMRLRSASLMEKIVQLHSPLPKDHEAWLYAWKFALTEACGCGDLSLCKWLMEHWLGREVCSDMLDEFDRASLMSAASSGGHVEVMAYIHQLKLFDELRPRAIMPAIFHRRLNAVKWFFGHGWRADRNHPFAILNEAATRGDLDMLKFFHSLDRLDVCHTTFDGEVRLMTLPMRAVWAQSRVMHLAATNDHLHVMKWLHANGLGESSITMLIEAAGYGYLEVVKWICANLPEIFKIDASTAMEKAAANGHVEVVKWFFTVLPHDCKNQAIDDAAGNGYLDVVKWLHENTNAVCSSGAMDRAAAHGHLGVLTWLHENTDAGCSTNAMDGAAAKGHLDVVKWLHEHRSQSCSATALERALGNIDFKMVIWLRQHFPDLVPVNLYPKAYHEKFFEMVLYLSVHHRELYTRDFIDSMIQRLKSNGKHGFIAGSDTHIASWLQDTASKFHSQSQ